MVADLRLGRQAWSAVAELRLLKDGALRAGEVILGTWVWVKIKAPGCGSQVLHVSICQGKPFWLPMFDPQPFQGIFVRLHLH